MAQSTSKVWLFLLKLYHADWLVAPTAFWLVNNSANVTGPAGQVYTAYPFIITLPQDRDDRPPEVTLSIDNVGSYGRSIYTKIAGMADPSPIQADLSIVLSDTPSTIEAGPYSFRIPTLTMDELTITASLTYESLFDEAFPAHVMSPHYFPGLFRVITELPVLRGDDVPHGGPAGIFGETPKKED
jgi:hypothetical protein